MKPSVQLYQIAYSDATFLAIEPGYSVLDNRSNPRPDWYEYWAIRQHLMNTALDEASFYGFFSPKFGSKTGLSHAQAVAFVQMNAATADVCLFSPQPDMGAFFLNVFEQAELFDPGFIAAFSAFLESVGRPTSSLATMIMDSRQIVFSNYFVARPAFWREWLKLTEAMFAICEGPATPLREQLTCATTYGPNAPRKVFMLERLASYLLVTQPQWRTRAGNTFNFAWSASRLSTQPIEAIISDALKIAMREQGYPQYQMAFNEVRRRFMASKPD
jgi:hypothetical protein